MEGQPRQVLILNLDGPDDQFELELLARRVQVRRVSCGGDPERARALIREFDGEVDAIGLDGLPATLQLGRARVLHDAGRLVVAAGNSTPVVDGHGIRAGLERWGVILANRSEPGIFAGRSVLMFPGLNHSGLAQALSQRTPHVRYADPMIFFGLPQFRGLGSRKTLEQVAPSALEGLKSFDFSRLRPQSGPTEPRGPESLFRWADVLAGDADIICRYAPRRLHRKTVVVEAAGPEQVEDLAQRGVSILVTMMPSLQQGEPLARFSAAVIEAVLVAVRPRADLPLTEDTYLNLIADLDWAPGIRYLQAEEAGIHRFAFVIHPLDVTYIHKHPAFRWTRFFPSSLVESVAAHLPPF
jgi:hypothetical protein